MSKAEELANKYGLCNCSEMYKSRNLTAPDCPLHAYAFLECMEEYRQSEIDTINNSVKIYNEVIDDQKREIDELRAEVDRLKEKINIVFGFPCLNDTQCETQCYTCKYVATGLTNKTNNK